MYKIILLELFMIANVSLLTAQNSEYRMKSNADEITVDFLSSYYDQTGNHSAVEGGEGTEDLEDIASVIIINVPLDTVQAITVTAGADYYSSASTDMIDNQRSSASSKDLRAYASVGYTRKNLGKGLTYGAKANFSTEYDYVSVSGGLSLAKEFNEGNSELSFNAQAFFDNWETYFPNELERKVSVPTSARRSYNFQASFAQVINKRMQLLLSGEAIYMEGLLSTPFHRVYFADSNTPDIERLPLSRLKIPLGVRLNIFPMDALVVRTYYRYYTDDWGIQAHTASVELPLKISTALTFSPFYRYHTQTASDYFAPLGVHTSDQQFYTSDYDLSALDSHKFGLGIKITPLYGLSRGKVPFSKKVLTFKSLDVRGAYYSRSTDLRAFIFSVGLNFVIK